jgi:8-oxo-dGTP pyrophosphatase MutT (NUDIX family)
MRWTVHGERVIYDSPWLRLALTDIEIPNGPRFEHHIVRSTAHAAGTVITDPERGVLLLWRHRFATDSWGWEIPAGRIDPGETPAEAAAREAYEETGWRPGPVTELFTYNPQNGVSDTIFNVFTAIGAVHIGDPTDASESERIEWLTWPRLRVEIAERRVLDGLSLTALLWVLAFEPPSELVGSLPGRPDSVGVG